MIVQEQSHQFCNGASTYWFQNTATAFALHIRPMGPLPLKIIQTNELCDNEIFCPSRSL